MDPIAIYVILGACAGGFVQGLSGFAFGLVSMAFWAWVLPPNLAAPMVVFGSLLGQILTIGTIRRGFDARRTAPFVAGGLLGVPLGAMLLWYIDPVYFKLAIGIFLVVYCSAMLALRSFPRIETGGRAADAASGLAGGVMGGLAGMAGPIPTLWCTLRGWGRDEQRAVFQTFNITMHAVTLTMYAIIGLIETQTLLMFALVAPAMVIPNLIGARLYSSFTETTFRRLVLGLLTCTGIAMLAATVPRLLA